MRAPPVLRALSIRQPYAELILRGHKRIEYRTVNVKSMLGQPFYIYASKKKLSAVSDQRSAAENIWSDDLAVTTPRRGEHVPQWMMELAQELILGKLPTGVIVGTAVIEKVTPPLARGGLFEWHLVDVERLVHPRRPTGHPQPVWFTPFGEGESERESESGSRGGSRGV